MNYITFYKCPICRTVAAPASRTCRMCREQKTYELQQDSIFSHPHQTDVHAPDASTYKYTIAGVNGHVVIMYCMCTF